MVLSPEEFFEGIGWFIVVVGKWWMFIWELLKFPDFLITWEVGEGGTVLYAIVGAICLILLLYALYDMQGEVLSSISSYSHEGELLWELTRKRTTFTNFYTWLFLIGLWYYFRWDLVMGIIIFVGFILFAIIWVDVITAGQRSADPFIKERELRRKKRKKKK
jgi:hypothetical protein